CASVKLCSLTDGAPFLVGTCRVRVFHLPARQASEGHNMRIERRFTRTGQSPYADIEFRDATSEIRNPDGSIVFRLENISVPAHWSQVATDILAQKYFRKAGVPARLRKIEENS